MCANGKFQGIPSAICQIERRTKFGEDLAAVLLAYSLECSLPRIASGGFIVADHGKPTEINVAMLVLSQGAPFPR